MFSSQRRIGLFFIGAGEQVIDAGTVEISELNQYIRGDIALADFVVGIADLRTLQVFCEVFLQKIPVDAQVANATVHFFRTSPFDLTEKVYAKQNVILHYKTKCFIITINKRKGEER